MKIRWGTFSFVVIGVAIGIILALQIGAKPIKSGSSPVDQMETQRALLNAFTLEQEDLKKSLDAISQKLDEAHAIIARRSSSQTLQTLAHLKKLAGLDAIKGKGVRITLNDSTSVTRVDYSALNENFVQATDLRDVINYLFLQGAHAISVNGKRVLSLTPIQSVFDNILIGNFKIAPPFAIEAIGNPDALKEATTPIQRRKIQVFVDFGVNLNIEPAESVRSIQFLSLASS